MRKICLALLAFFAFSKAHASWDSAEVRAAGNYIETNAVTVSNAAATLLYTQDVWDVNVDIFNNSGFVIWIGTNTTSLATTGFPLLSSATYTTDGQFTGAIYGLADSAAGGSVNARIIRFKRSSR